MSNDPHDMRDEPQENHFRILYERFREGGYQESLLRIHFEDICEALRLAAEHTEAQEEYERHIHEQSQVRF